MSNGPNGGVTKRRRWPRVLLILFLVSVIVFLGGAIVGFLYWQHLKSTPQYSIALLVDAARKNDQRMVNRIVNTDAVVDDFVPQITDKAIELYGRGLPKEVVREVADIAAPVLPVVKERARAELPKLLKKKTEQFEEIPFVALAVGADRYLEIRTEGDVARVSSRLADRPMEVVMKRNGRYWQIVAIKDETLAEKIAQRVGQQIIALVRDKGRDSIERAGRKIGLKNLGDILKKAEELLR